MEQKQDETVRKVAFLGASPTSRHLAPFGDDGWEVWGMGPAWQDDGKVILEPYPKMRWDRWFEIHDMDINDPNMGAVDIPGYWEWIEAQGQHKPFYFRPPIYKGLRGYELPWDELIERHGTYFFDSTAAWMMAFAYEKRFFPNIEEIGIYGIDFATEKERRVQKPGTYYFMQLFKLRGVRVHVPDASDMSYQRPAYPDVDPFIKKCEAQARVMEERKFRAEKNRDGMLVMVRQQEDDLLRLEGAFQMLEYFKENRA